MRLISIDFHLTGVPVHGIDMTSLAREFPVPASPVNRTFLLKIIQNPIQPFPAVCHPFPVVWNISPSYGVFEHLNSVKARLAFIRGELFRSRKPCRIPSGFRGVKTACNVMMTGTRVMRRLSRGENIKPPRPLSTPFYHSIPFA